MTQFSCELLEGDLPSPTLVPESCTGTPVLVHWVAVIVYIAALLCSVVHSLCVYMSMHSKTVCVCKVYDELKGNHLHLKLVTSVAIYVPMHGVLLSLT